MYLEKQSKVKKKKCSRPAKLTLQVPLGLASSDIGSELDRLARMLVKCLSQLLGMICPARLKHLGDLLERTKSKNIRTRLPSYDITSLLTSVLTTWVIALLQQRITDYLDLPPSGKDFIGVRELCIGYNDFSFGIFVYRQSFGLA